MRIHLFIHLFWLGTMFAENDFFFSGHFGFISRKISTFVQIGSNLR